MSDPLPAPASGSTAWFMLLYAGAHRSRLQALLALADELAASFDPQLDHQVAHLRLAWWREESERTARGEARHPYTRALQRTALQLDALLAAAELELARAAHTAAAPSIPPMPFERGLFLACAQLLHDSPLPPALLAAVRAWADRLVATHAAEPIAWPASTFAGFAPLAVWVALARRRGPSPAATAATGWQQFQDNLRAWSAARGVTRGRFP